MATPLKTLPANVVTDDVFEHPSQQPQFIQSPAITPPHDSQYKTLRITQAQKQALIDNLQLEGMRAESPHTYHSRLIKFHQVTERARKLRAQYALQAQSLRTRIELRINRIPTSIRKANMGELFAKYQEIKKQQQSAASAEKAGVIPTEQQPSEQESVSAPIQSKKETDLVRLKGRKRNRFAGYLALLYGSQL